MNKQATIKILSAIGITFVIRLSLRGFFGGESPLTLVSVLLLIIQGGALYIFIWGCMDYARSKGYPAPYGFFGLLGCIGLIILAALRDKWKPTGPITSDTNYTRDPNRF